MRRLLLTGSTGFLGRALALSVLERDAESEIWALVRQVNGQPPASRPELAALCRCSRFHVVAGDLELPGLGLGTGACPTPDLPRDFDACFHLAARTEFEDRRRDAIVRANLEGTRHLVQLLKTLPRLGKLYHVSTAYVSGVGGGVVREVLHDGPRRYANPYEESKHAAEAVVAGSGLDWTILRPSILMGDSRTGRADSDKMVYGVFKAYWRLRQALGRKHSDAEIESLAANPLLVACRPEVAKNLICLDDVVRMILEVAARHPPSGTVYHLTNPRPTTIGEATEVALAVLHLPCLELRPEAGRRSRAEERVIERGTRVYRPYLLNEEASFDQSALRGLIGHEAVDAVLPMTTARLRFLLERYLHDQLETEGEAPLEAP